MRKNDLLTGAHKLVLHWFSNSVATGRLSS